MLLGGMREVDSKLRDLDRARWRMALALTSVIVLIYFGFIAMVAFGRNILAVQLTPGLSLGILLGAVVIIASWVLTWVYVRWANTVYDPAVRALSESSR
jgi:uncharacterized membrane protein (DUF485 family)